MNAPARREGWCPGALRPMESGDGLIVRLRLSCGEVSPRLAGEIADWAEAYGNGQIDLSARANLQLRGVSRATLPPLLEALETRGLLDASAEAEAVRNVLVSPFAGPDLTGVAKALEAELSANSHLWRLPGKFGFSLDAGAYPLGDARADVAFEAIDEATFRVRLAGSDATLGPVDVEDVVAVAVRLAEAFLGSEPRPRRMRDAVAMSGLEALADAAGLALLDQSAAPIARPLADLLGVHDGFVGAALPFGRIGADELRTLAGAAASLRLTPWRIILAFAAEAPTLSWPGLSRPSTLSSEQPDSEMRPKRRRVDARDKPGHDGKRAAGRAFACASPQEERESLTALARALSATDLILDSRDPRLRIAACVGSPACCKATMNTRAEAAALAGSIATLPGSGLALHVSGCAKGCAHPAAAPYTIVGESGSYALIENGRASDAPFASGLDRKALHAILEGAP